jgi:hypothetical protein
VHCPISARVNAGNSLLIRLFHLPFERNAMQATSTGLNLTGSDVSPEGCQAMLEAVNEFMVPGPLDTSAQVQQRIVYIDEA